MPAAVAPAAAAAVGRSCGGARASSVAGTSASPADDVHMPPQPALAAPQAVGGEASPSATAALSPPAVPMSSRLDVEAVGVTMEEEASVEAMEERRIHEQLEEERLLEAMEAEDRDDPLVEDWTDDGEITVIMASRAARLRALARTAARMALVGPTEVVAGSRRAPSKRKRKGSVQDTYAQLRAQERTQRVADITAELLADESEYSLHFSDDAELTRAVAAYVAALDDTNAPGTVVNEASNMRHWMAFCEWYRTPIWRKRRWVQDDATYRREEWIAVQAFIFIYGRMQPRSGSSTPPRPSSAVAVLRGIARAHRRLGHQFVGLKKVVAVAHTLTRQYMQRHFPNGLLPKRAEPFTNAEVEAVLQLKLFSCRGKVHEGSSTTGRSLRACFALLAQAGFRGSEVALASGKEFDRSCITRASVTWRIKGKLVTSPTPAQLRGLKVGDYVVITPPPSKCDAFGVAWGNSPIYLAWHRTRPTCAARYLAELELAAPVTGEARGDTPLFTFENGSMLTRPWLADALTEALKDTNVDAARIGIITLHSFRRFLACCLRANGETDSVICALLRWRSAKSLAAYAAMNVEQYAAHIDRAASATVDSIRTANINRMPVVEELDVAKQLLEHQASTDRAADKSIDEVERDREIDSD